jgi:two-component system response regulator MprA
MTDAPRARSRVLIVDDEPTIAESLRECLGADYQFELVHSGMEALVAVASERPDVVLLDVIMPGMSGIEVLRCLKVIDPSLPVIMITATEDAAQIDETMQLGALGYIPKPFSRE